MQLSVNMVAKCTRLVQISFPETEHKVRDDRRPVSYTMPVQLNATLSTVSKRNEVMVGLSPALALGWREKPARDRTSLGHGSFLRRRTFGRSEHRRFVDHLQRRLDGDGIP